MDKRGRLDRITDLESIKEERAPLDASPETGSWVTLATSGFVGLGILLRLGAYLLNFPLWWDEAFVAVNFLRRGYSDLLRPLDYGQVCPLFFLWAELTAVRWLGFSEWSLRLFPLLGSVASVVLFRVAAGQILRGRALLIAVAIFAVSVHPIRHAADVKPYATDLLVALVLQMTACWWWREPLRAGRLWGLAAVVPLAMLLSHTAVFVAGGIGLALAWPVWRTRRWDVRAAFAAAGLAMIATHVLIYVSFTRSQATAASPGMRAMWSRSFPPLDSIVGLGRWLAVAHSGDMLAYPCGGEGGGSLLSLLACGVGAVVLWRRGRSVIVGCLLAPLGLAMVAAALRLYPYGGPAPHGSSARIMQYAATGLCLLIGVGVSRGLDMVRSPRFQTRLLRVGCIGLIGVGVVPLCAGLAHPYRAYQARASRDFASRFWPLYGRGAEVACLRWDFDGVAEWDSVRLGIAVSLCNQAIYSPSRRTGGPRWGDISADRLLRCVLGVASESDGPKVASWLAEMGARYDLRRRNTIEFNTAEPGRKPIPERYEVFEFVLKAAAVHSVGQWGVKFRAPALGDHPETADDVLGKIGRGSVDVERGLVVVLLVQEELRGIGRRLVRPVHPTSRLVAGGDGQDAEPIHRLVFRSRLYHIGHGQADHLKPRTSKDNRSVWFILSNRWLARQVRGGSSDLLRWRKDQSREIVECSKWIRHNELRRGTRLDRLTLRCTCLRFVARTDQSVRPGYQPVLNSGVVNVMVSDLTHFGQDEPQTCARREEILDAATNLFAEFGYSDAVTKDLAEKLQVGKGTIYRYFPSKRDLFLAAVDRVMRRLREYVDKAIADVEDPLDRIEAGTRAFLGFFAAHPRFVELLILERALFKDRTTPTYYVHRERNKLRWHDLYRAMIAEGRFRDMPVERISTVFLDLAYGTIFTNYFSGRCREPEDQARDILDVIFHGILGKSEQDRRPSDGSATPSDRSAP